jgi:hypothetical protein
MLYLFYLSLEKRLAFENENVIFEHELLVDALHIYLQFEVVIDIYILFLRLNYIVINNSKYRYILNFFECNLKFNFIF